jgi:hypothetical protein
MAQRRSEGLSLAAVAAEFHTNVERVRQAIKRVEAHDRGRALLREDPASIEAFDLMGELPPLVRHTLAEHGIVRLDDIQGYSAEELLRLPNLGKKAVAQLLEMLENYRMVSTIDKP